MADILDLNERKRHLAAKKGLGPWSRRFGVVFADDTSVRDLDSSVIRFFIRGGEESAMALYEFIMGVQGLGAGQRFHHLDSDNKMRVMDITLFLLDLMRFEAMYRLEWLDEYDLLKTPMLDLVQNFRKEFWVNRHAAPSFNPAHPLFEQYNAQFEGDRNSFVRKLIPEAIQAFCKGDQDGGES